METARTGDNQTKRKSKRKLRVLLVAVLLVGLAGFLWARKMLERKEFVSQIDPVSGYRCRFTVGAGWKQGGAGIGDEAIVEAFHFIPPPGNPVLQWIADHLLHHSPSNAADNSIEVDVISIPNGTSLPLRNGYPDASIWGPNLSERHFKIDGCLASVATIKYFSVSSSGYLTGLLIYTPDEKRFYEGIAVYSTRGDATDREMQQIIRSFHIEKVDKPPREAIGTLQGP